MILGDQNSPAVIVADGGTFVESENEEMRLVIALQCHKKTTTFNLKSKFIDKF